MKQGGGMTVWSVYLIRCGDRSLYTGIATDVDRRLEEHRAGTGKGSKYLRGRGPLELVACSEVGAHGPALRAEARIKKLSRLRKEVLIASPGLMTTITRDPAVE
jgi:putative endonuclease